MCKKKKAQTCYFNLLPFENGLSDIFAGILIIMTFSCINNTLNYYRTLGDHSVSFHTAEESKYLSRYSRWGGIYKVDETRGVSVNS